MLLKVRSFLRAFWSLFREGDASMELSAADAPEGDVVIHDHAELLGALGFS